MADVTFELVDASRRFDEIGQEWDRLVDVIPRPCPFLLAGWCRATLGSRQADRHVAIHLARRGTRIVAALPFVVEHRRYWRVARFASGPWSYFADALLAPDEPVGTLHDLCEWARRSGSFHFAKLWGMTSTTTLSRALPAGDLRLTRFVVAPYLEMPDGWEAAYRRHTTSKSRNSHKRRARQLGEAGRVEVSVASEAPALARALDVALHIHARRWSDRPDVSDFGRPRRAAFQREALASMAELGLARILTLSLEGTPVAFMYYLLYRSRMYVLALGFDPAYGRFSPGLTANLRAFEAAGAEGATTIEFLEGTERYKLELADGTHALHTGVALPVSPASRAAAGLAFSYGACRSAAKSVSWARRSQLTVTATRRRREAVE
jgi:CelD/BcsL family acetyltransferase involved in cellulose biosynthesis